MKKAIFLTLIFIAFSFYKSFSQRYLTPVFDSIVVLDSVPYGAANDYKGGNTALAMDIYLPNGDTATKRPLLVLAHGGSFIGGNRKATDIATVCKEFAKRGYVCASIKYRLGVNLNPSTLANEFANAVWRGALDGRGAIRFFNKDFATTNTYKIDPTNIYVGGISAGGVLGLHLAFLDKSMELITANPAIDTTTIGGIEGTSGSAGYNWKIKGVISLCGAIGTSAWMNDNKNISVVSVHGTNDNTVPFKTDFFKVSGFPISKLSGSFVVDSLANANGNVSALKVFYGQDHVPFTTPNPNYLAYMDTTVRFVANFLYTDIKRVQTNSSVHNKDFAEQIGLKIFPVPANEHLFVQFNNMQQINILVELYDINGRTVLRNQTQSNQVIIERRALPNGMYLIRVKSELGETVKKIILE